MRQAVFFGKLKLRKRSAVRKLKNRVISKPFVPALSRSNSPRQNTFNAMQRVGGLQGNNCFEVCAAFFLRNFTHHAQHLCTVLGVRRILTRKPRRKHSRRTAQRVNFQPRVVGHCPQPRSVVGFTCFLDGVAQQIRCVFFCRRQRREFREAQELNRQVRQLLLNLAELIRVARGDD